MPALRSPLNKERSFHHQDSIVVLASGNCRLRALSTWNHTSREKGQVAMICHMINRLLSLIAEVAQFPGIETMPSPPIAGPVPSLQGRPQEDFDL